MSCWLRRNAVFEDGPMPPCEGRLRKVHLIPQQLLKRYGADPWDRRAWVWSCGGPMGNSGHHGMLDASRRLRVPRINLPAGTERLAAELGIEWWLAREYGEHEA